MKYKEINIYRIIIGIAFILSAVHFYHANIFTMANAIDYQDTQIFVDAAINWKNTGQLYSLAEPINITYKPGAAVFKFPPIYVLPYLPWLDIIHAELKPFLYSCLYVFHIARYALACILLNYLFGKKNIASRQLLFGTLFCLSTPVLECLNGMTFENLLLLAATMIIILLRNQKPWITATIFSYVVLAKMYPAFIGIYFLSRHRISIVPAIIVSTVAWLALSVSLLGIDEHINYYTKVLPILLDEPTLKSWINISPVFTILDNPTQIKLATGFILLASIVLMNVHTGTTQLNLMHFSLACTLPLLLLKNSWVSYQIILMIPICILIGAGLGQRGVKGYYKVVIAVAAILPLLSTKNHPFLQLPYYPLLESLDWFNSLHEKLHDWRTFSALVLWVGIAGIIIAEKPADTLRSSDRDIQVSQKS